MNAAETPAVVRENYPYTAHAGMRGGLGEYFEQTDDRATVRDGLFTPFAGMGRVNPRLPWGGTRRGPGGGVCPPGYHFSSYSKEYGGKACVRDWAPIAGLGAETTCAAATDCKGNFLYEDGTCEAGVCKKGKLKMTPIIIGGVAVLGIGWLLLRKKR